MAKESILSQKPKKVKSRRLTMRDNNTYARMYLVDSGFCDVWLKPHGRFLDSVWSHKDGKEYIKYRARDIWNLFDGIAVSSAGHAVFLAISDRWKGEDEIEKFLQDTVGFQVLMIKVIDKTNILTKWYLSPCR